MWWGIKSSENVNHLIKKSVLINQFNHWTGWITEVDLIIKYIKEWALIWLNAVIGSFYSTNWVLVEPKICHLSEAMLSCNINRIWEILNNITGPSCSNWCWLNPQNATCILQHTKFWKKKMKYFSEASKHQVILIKKGQNSLHHKICRLLHSNRNSFQLKKLKTLLMEIFCNLKRI